MPPIRALPVVALLCLSLATPALARDFEEEGRVRDAEALIAKLTEAQAAKGDAPLRALLSQVPGLHNKLRTKSAMQKLQKAVGDVLGDGDLKTTVHIAAVDAAAKLHDDKGVWSLLKRVLPEAREEAAGQVGLRALDALGTVAPDEAISTLTTLAKKAKDSEVAVRAIRALGGYRLAKKRVQILKFLADLAARIRPGRGGQGAGRGAGREARERYQRLSRPLVDALNSLTGRTHEGIEVWLTIYQEHKKNPEELFRINR
jgi:hypothetical protein